MWQECQHDDWRMAIIIIRNMDHGAGAAFNLHTLLSRREVRPVTHLTATSLRALSHVGPTRHLHMIRNRTLSDAAFGIVSSLAMFPLHFDFSDSR